MEHATKIRIKEELQSHLADKISGLPSDTDNNQVRKLIVDSVTEQALLDGQLSHTEVDKLAKEMVNEFLYLGPLQPLIADEGITEIMVNGGGFDQNGRMLPHETWIERDGILERRYDVAWDNEAHVQRIMNRILSRQGRRIDDSNPIEDGTLIDGSRFSGTLFPISPDGSSFNVRKFRKDSMDVQEYLSFGTASIDEMNFLSTLTAAKGSILISGGTGSGKTTLLNILSSFIPEGERIITIEDTCELLVHTTHSHVVRFECRKKNTEGAGEITLEQLLESSLRKRPDRIIIGECRGSEAYTMLEAMNTGHEGSMTTIHANDPLAALRRLVTLVKQGDSTLSEDIIKEKIADAIDCVVQVQRLPNGRRVITQIESIGRYIDGNIQHDSLFKFEENKDGHMSAKEHKGLGVQSPTLREKIENAGFHYDPTWFFQEENL